MRLGQLLLQAVPLPAAGGLRASVQLRVAFGFFRHNMDATPDQAREMAAELLQAANKAEGKA